MRWLGFVITISLFAAVTGGALLASAAGWGLPGPLEEPVSIREASRKRRAGVAPLIYFGRSHYGGGYRGGK